MKFSTEVACETVELTIASSFRRTPCNHMLMPSNRRLAQTSTTGRRLNFTKLSLSAPDDTALRKVVRAERTVIAGTPAEAHISTSFIERQNLTMRMSMRRFTRLTKAFSKKIENHRAAVALHFAHYNFVRLHRTLRTPPAMAANVSSRLWSLEELVNRTSA